MFYKTNRNFKCVVKLNIFGITIKTVDVNLKNLTKFSHFILMYYVNRRNYSLDQCHKLNLSRHKSSRLKWMADKLKGVQILNRKNSLNKLNPSHCGYHSGSMTNRWIIQIEGETATKKSKPWNHIN
jgi:hypothetical protein